jgi:GTP1/Obg family GTP-binding protein
MTNYDNNILFWTDGTKVSNMELDEQDTFFENVMSKVADI